MRYLSILLVSVWVSSATADDEAYQTDLETLQQRIEAAKQGEQPRLPSARERELEAQLVEMEKRAERAEEELATCKAALSAR